MKKISKIKVGDYVDLTENCGLRIVVRVAKTYVEVREIDEKTCIFPVTASQIAGIYKRVA